MNVILDDKESIAFDYLSQRFTPFGRHRHGGRIVQAGHEIER